MATSKAEKKTEAVTPEKSSSSKLANFSLFMNLLNLVATIGMVVILFISFQRERKTSSIEDLSIKSEETTDGHSDPSRSPAGEGHDGAHKNSAGPTVKMVTLDPFTINLSTPGSVTPKFVRVNIALEVINGETEEEVASKTPQIRNTIIDLFNGKRPNDLVNVDGRDFLKEEIKNSINSFLLSGKVKAVYFTNFALSS